MNAQDAVGETALHRAVRFQEQFSQRTRLIPLLCDLGANINAQSFQGETPLHVGTKLRHFRSVDTLRVGVGNFEAGSGLELHLQDSNGDTALGIAIRDQAMPALSKSLIHFRVNGDRLARDKDWVRNRLARDRDSVRNIVSGHEKSETSGDEHGTEGKRS